MRRLAKSMVALGLFGTSVQAQEIVPAPSSPERTGEVRIEGHILKPQELPTPDLKALKVPDGFKIEHFAINVGNARLLAIGPDGSVYVTRRDQGDVLKYRVAANGLADGPPMRVASRSGLHGIDFYKNQVYLATTHEIFRGEVLKDGTFGPLEMLIHDLPDAGQHATRTVRIGPDDMMYIGVGSTCNECAEPNPENATILRASLDGKHRSIFATGLRDPIGWDWHPITGEMWEMDHGIDWLGDDLQPEELNHIQKGKNYGWPYIFADNKINPRIDPTGGLTKVDWQKISTPMILGYTAHAAPMQLAFYSGNQFPEKYRNSAFVSMRGSWNRKPASGYEILYIPFKDGRPTGFEPFVTGFLSSKGQSARPVGNAVARDGTLLFTDDRNGVIYRVSSILPSGQKSAQVPHATPPSEPMRLQNKVSEKTPLAGVILEATSKPKIVVTSTAFRSGEAIPAMHSAYDQDASIPLAWDKLPAGTKTLAILMEDPDATSAPLPVVHWVAWNIPVVAASLREGLEASAQLDEPKGLRQGVNYRGAIGYTGPRPPEGEPDHRYHVQVFAVDKALDIPIGAKREDLLAALKGHVMAMGDLQGLFKRPVLPRKP